MFAPHEKQPRLLVNAKLRSYFVAPGPLPPAPSSHVLLVVMTFLENQSMLLVLLFHCFCECSYFEINLMVEKFNSVSPTLLSSFLFCFNQEPLINEEIVVIVFLRLHFGSCPCAALSKQ